MDNVAAIEEAQRAAEAALDAALSYLRAAPEPTSDECRALVGDVLNQLGYDLPEGCIVAGGADSAQPHHQGAGVLKPGEPIVIDIYPRSRATGFWGDLSRTVCLGTPPPHIKAMYQAVLGAQELALSLVRPGAMGGDIHQAVDNYFADQGFETEITGPMQGHGFIHGTGHGVGQDIHEAPRIGKDSPDVLAVGDVITIEPGLYYPALGGVRIEDVVVVTPDGCRNLTRAPKNFELH